MRKKTLIEMLIEAGYPKEQIHHHGIDLYVEVTPLTTKVLEDWCKQNGWDERLIRNDSFVFSTFIDSITGKRTYDVAFQYIGMPE